MRKRAVRKADIADAERAVALDSWFDEVAPEAAGARTGPAWGKIALIALVVTALAAIWRYTPLADFLTAERIIGWADSVGAVRWAPIAVMFLYLPATLVMFPRPLITLFAVMAFGPWLGFVYAMTGIMLASLATYYIGRALPRDTVQHIAGKRLNRVIAVLRRRGLLAVFAMRIIPVAPHSVEGIVCGAVHIKLWHYAAGTFLGMAPGTLTTTVFGDQLQAALEDPSQINYWLVAGAVLLILMLILIVRRWFMREHAMHLRHKHAH
jgi:phospholipase D1/2